MAIKPDYKFRYNHFVSSGLQASLIKMAAIISIITITGTGCAFSKYKLAKKNTPPPIEMNLNLSQPPIDVLLQSVIIYQGPGSWKRKAYWDEYIVSITNQGELPLSIESATLVDFQDKANVAGANPWELEKQSKTWWKNVRSSTLGGMVVLGAGTLALASASIGVGTATVLSGSTTVPAMAAIGFVAAPVIVVSYVVGNIIGHGRIEKEFERRRLVLPVNIPADQAIQGSLFFPITPGPKHLILSYQIDDETHIAEFNLSHLKTLHIKEEEDRRSDSSYQKQNKKD